MQQKKEKVIDKLKNDPLMPLRHTAEHILHIAMSLKYPSLKKVMGPPIEDGFYFDFDLDEKVSPEIFDEIEKVMHEIIEAKLPISHKEITAEEARAIFKDNKYKLENIQEIADRGEKVSVYIFGSPESKYYDVDLCAGPHVDNTSKVKAFKLLSVAGAYYKGDEKNKMLQRIYGTAFDSQEALEAHLALLEEAKNRDHRKIGKEMDLFTFADDVGAGLPLWTAKGTIIREEIEKWAKETEEEWGYVRVATPHIGKHTLYETSGHLPYYKDDMYSPMDIDGEDYYLKGMNCPHHHMIYKSQPRSYRDLPMRMAEYGTVYRYEQSGSLFGLMRVRSIAQNDAHIYCTLEQAEEEFLISLKLHEYYYETLGLTKDDYRIVFGLPDETKREKYHGDKELWDEAEAMMKRAVEKSGIRSSDDIGGAAFYGPKTDFNVKSSIGREFAISTVQLDLYMPQRFNLEYTAADGSKKICAVIHRAPLGSHERFVGFLIEHFGGAFPVWLAPEQVEIIPINEKVLDYANEVHRSLRKAKLRSKVNDRDDTMQSKIREAQHQKLPYMLILGGREQEQNTVSIRLRTGEQINGVSVEEFIRIVTNVRDSKSLALWEDK